MNSFCLTIVLLFIYVNCLVFSPRTLRHAPEFFLLPVLFFIFYIIYMFFHWVSLSYDQHNWQIRSKSSLFTFSHHVYSFNSFIRFCWERILRQAGRQINSLVLFILLHFHILSRLFNHFVRRNRDSQIGSLAFELRSLYDAKTLNRFLPTEWSVAFREGHQFRLFPLKPFFIHIFYLGYSGFWSPSRNLPKPLSFFSVNGDCHTRSGNLDFHIHRFGRVIVEAVMLWLKQFFQKGRKLKQ